MGGHHHTGTGTGRTQSRIMVAEGISREMTDVTIAGGGTAAADWLQHVIDFIRAMPPDAFWLLLVTLLLVVILAFTVGMFWAHSYHIMRSTPTVMVRSAMDGYVELAGHLEPLATGGTITAPVSGKPCVWYRCRVQELDLSLSGGLWVDLFVDEEQRPCRLRDGSGICILDTPLALAIFGRKRETWTVNLPLRRKPLPHALQGMDRDGLRTPLRFVEERLEANVPGYAIGEMHTVRLTDGDDEPARKAIDGWKRWRTDYIPRLRGAPERVVPNPDVPQAVEVRRRAIPAYARACGMRGKWFRILGPTDSVRHPFLVAGEDQRLLGRRLRRRIAITAMIAALAAAPLILLLLARYGDLG